MDTENKKSKDEVELLYNSILKLINDNDKKKNEYIEEINNDIKELLSVYEDMKSLIQSLIRSKVGAKTLSEMFNSLVNVRKTIIDVKEKKYKTSDYDIKLIKNIYDTINKKKNITGDKQNEDADISITNILSKL